MSLWDGTGSITMACCVPSLSPDASVPSSWQTVTHLLSALGILLLSSALPNLSSLTHFPPQKPSPIDALGHTWALTAFAPSMARGAAPQSHQRANTTPKLSGFSPAPSHFSSLLMTATSAETPTCHQPAQNHPHLPDSLLCCLRPPAPKHLRAAQQAEAGRRQWPPCCLLGKSPRRQEPTVARLHRASTMAGSQGEGHVSGGSSSHVPSVTMDSHTAMEHLHASTATQACSDPKAQPTPSPEHRLPPAPWQLRHSASDLCTRIQWRQTQDSHHQSHITLRWLHTFRLLLQGRAQKVWKFIKASCKTKSCSAHPLHQVRQPRKARNVPLPGKHILLKRHAVAVSRVQSTLGAGKQIYDTTVHLGHSTLPAKVHQEALAVGKNITGEGRGESKLLNVQHTTSSNAMAHGEPALWMH